MISRSIQWQLCRFAKNRSHLADLQDWFDIIYIVHRIKSLLRYFTKTCCLSCCFPLWKGLELHALTVKLDALHKTSSMSSARTVMLLLTPREILPLYLLFSTKFRFSMTIYWIWPLHIFSRIKMGSEKFYK